MRDIKAPKLKPLIINNPDDAALKWTGEKVLGEPESKQPAENRRVEPKAVRLNSPKAKKRRRRKQLQRRITLSPVVDERLVQLVQALGRSASDVVADGINRVYDANRSFL